MWAKSVTQFLVIQTLLILQISYGMPTSEELSNPDTTESDIESQADVNSSFLASVSILLTVLSLNDTTTTTIPLFANVNATVEPDYDDYNVTSHSLSEAEDDLDSLSINGSTNATHSSLLPLLITDEMEMADSLDDSVTATLMLQEDHSSISIGSSTASSDEDGDSIIIASMSSNLSPDTASSPNSATVATEAGELDEESSKSDDYSSSESSSLLPYVEMLL